MTIVERRTLDSSDVMRLTFASYNIRKAIGLDRRRNPERILAVLREIDADVVALQEADRRLGRRASALPREMIEEHTGYEDYTLYILVMFLVATFYIVVSHVLSSARDARTVARKSTMKGK